MFAPWRRRSVVRPRGATPPRAASGMSPPLAASVQREVVGVLVATGPLELDLHEHVVEQRRGAEAEPVRRHPAGTERLVQDDQVLDRLLGRLDTAGRLHPDLST